MVTEEQVDEAEMLARDDQKNGEYFRAQRDVLALVAEVRWLRWLVERVASLTADEIAKREQVEQLVVDARALLATEEVGKR